MLLGLANEILIHIVKYLEDQHDVNSICRTNRQLYSLFNDYLYQFNIHFRGGDAILWAAKHDSEPTARKLLYLGVPINIAFRTSPLHSVQRLTALEDPLDLRGITPLHIASWKGHRKLVNLLLDVGADPDAQMPNGWTPLYLALISGKEKIARTLSWHVLNLTNHLVDFNRQLSPLHVASRLGLSNMVRFFLGTGADVNARDSQRNTPLHHALASSCLQLGYRSETIAPLTGDWIPSLDHIFETVTEILNAGAIASLEGHASTAATKLGILHQDQRIQRLFSLNANDSIPKISKSVAFHVGRSWMFRGQHTSEEQNLVNNELWHLEQRVYGSKSRQFDRESVIRRSMSSAFSTESRMNLLQHEAERSDLTAFPLLGEITTSMISDSRMGIGGTVWSCSKTKLLIANLVREDSPISSTAQHVNQVVSFPRLANSAKPLMNDASKKMWVTFRQPGSSSSCTAPADNPLSLRNNKTKRKNRWRPFTL